MKKYLQLAFSLLTILPVGSSDEPPEPGDTGVAAIWFPCVGLVVGLISAVGWWILHTFLPVLPATVLTLVLWVVLTGGLHLDGLADCCDGLLSAHKPERRLEIMADPHIGSFGMVGLVLFLITKFSALYSVNPANVFFVVIFSSTFSRWLVLIGGKQPLARSEGMAADLVAGLSTPSILMAAFLPVALMVLGGWQAALAAAVSALAVVGIFAFARTRIGGVTGDVFGLTIEIAELMVLLTYAALSR